MDSDAFFICNICKPAINSYFGFDSCWLYQLLVINGKPSLSRSNRFTCAHRWFIKAKTEPPENPNPTTAMTVRKVILYSLLLPVLIFLSLITISLIKDNKFPDIDYLIFLTAGLFLPWAIGVLLGVFVTVLVRKPKLEPWFYLSGQLLVVTTIVCLLLVNAYRQAVHRQNFGNIEHNHYLVDLDNKYSFSARDPYVQTAFRKLESSFANPNDFRLSAYFSQVTGEDNTVPVYFVYFSYKRKGRGEFFSKIRVLQDSAFVEILGGNPKTNSDFTRQKSRNDSIRNVEIQALQDALQDLPDSARNEIMNNLEKSSYRSIEFR
ncbi:MAG: hypothetical protein P0Y53_06710 [Candidatus Pseudobacter hemicellulosilyticus]|uniref:Uncharacterized protein n=1 Tax=Candidatus Pseudobacter hemicellulosilyticus TaxID=3121375 RepID=A0AAJ5WU65_9BACT|nr:MAG: hypothetical protein P0Y53_06710 [Pseudobacter sp.]